MKHFGSTIALISALLLASGCSTSPKAQENSAATTKQDESHSPGHGETPKPMPSDSHGGHGMEHPNEEESSPITQAKLTAPSNIKPNTSVTLAIAIQDKAGKPITQFERFQEKLLHLIVVSDDLQVFRHLHPTYRENGRFEVEANFPQPGSYTLFSDYKPTGGAEEVSVLQTKVTGKSPSSPAIEIDRTKTFGDTKVNFTFSPPTIKTGQEVHLIFNLQNPTDSQPIKDLQPYLGERGHLVIIKQSSPLTRADYIHAHALKDTPEGEVHFITSFPQAGKYKLWGQFDRAGKIVTADFWVNVQ
ncbi:MAG: hypothetical protein KME17_23465 [Cyanosarcina radialis HA8281-LM2]|jgi:hypothetical protein|nr:hypothetical protein [Cyanosarcina radialis HA8281-LM2]